MNGEGDFLNAKLVKILSLLTNMTMKITIIS